MNVAVHQEKENNDKTKVDKRKAGERSRQATDLKKTACCPSAVVHGALQRKNDLYESSARSNWDPQENQQPF